MSEDFRSMTGSSSTYRADIDGLRAVAVLLVVSHHAFPQVVPGGFIGVDVFFVISGYLIGGIVLRQVADLTFSLWDFYARRIRRIFPALILVLTVCLLMGWWVLLASEYDALGRHVTYGALFWLNFVLKNEVGYFDTAAQLKPLLHLWSLSIEEQFYIIWPVAVLVFHRVSLNVFGALIFASVVSLAGCLYFNVGSPIATFYHPATRIWELLLGTVFAYIELHRREWFVRWRCRCLPVCCKRGNPFDCISNFQTGVGLLLIGLSGYLLNRQHSLGVYSLLPVVGALLIITASPDCWANRHLLSFPFIMRIGLISFPLYLWHWPLLSFATIINAGFPSTGTRIVLILISGILAYLTWAGLERRLRHHPARWVPFQLLISLMVVATAGYFVNRGDGFRERTVSYDKYIDQFSWSWWKLKNHCLPVFRGHPDSYCYKDDDQQPHVVLLGDSHALHLYPGLSRHFQQEGLILLGASSCMPFYGLNIIYPNGLSRNCREIVDPLIDAVVKSQDITTVVLSYRGASYVEGTSTSFEMEKGEVPENHWALEFPRDRLITSNAQAYRRAMDITLETLLHAGKKVIMVIDVPELDFDPRSCVRMRPFLIESLKSPCSVAEAAYRVRSANYLKITREVLKKFPSTQVWDTTRYLCQDNFCRAMIGDSILYRDDDHLSVTGSRWLSEHFDPKPASVWLASHTD